MRLWRHGDKGGRELPVSVLRQLDQEFAVVIRDSGVVVSNAGRCWAIKYTNTKTLGDHLRKLLGLSRSDAFEAALVIEKKIQLMKRPTPSNWVHGWKDGF